MRTYGMYASDMSDVEEAKNRILNLPYSYELPDQDKIIDQGDRGICVSVSMKEAIEFHGLMRSKKLNIPMDYFYNKRQNKKLDGMTVKEAMEQARKDKYIERYAKIQDPDTLKSSILTQGPCIICLNVKDSTREEFWKGAAQEGGHALVAIGWDKNGFILKNSWGYGYGIEGLGTLSYKDWNYIRELWTIL